MVRLSTAGKFWLTYLGCFLLVAYLLLRAVGAFGQAQVVTAEWDSNTEPDLAGYRIYWSQEQGSYGNAFDIPAVNFVPKPGVNIIQTGWLAAGTWYFVATAFDLAGNESGFSSEATAIIPDVEPGTPTSVKFQIILPDGTIINLEVASP